MPERNSWGKTAIWVRVGVVSWSVIGLAIILLGILWLLGQIWSAVLSLMLGSLMVMALKTPVAWLVSRGMKRSMAAGIAVLAALGLLVAFGFFVLPTVAGQAGKFVQEFPTYWNSAFEWFVEMQERYAALKIPDWTSDIIAQLQSAVTEGAGGFSKSLATGILSAGSQVLGLVAAGIMGLVIGFYLLAALPRIAGSLLAMVPPKVRPEMIDIGHRINVVVGGFIRGQALIAVIVGILTGVAMAILGVPFAGMIGLIAGVSNIVPYLGPIVGGSIAAVVALFVDPWLMVWAIVAVIAIQQIEGTFLSPKIMSDQVGLHPVIVILALIAGGSLFGLVGMLLAVPVAGTIKAVWVYYVERQGWDINAAVEEAEAVMVKTSETD